MNFNATSSECVSKHGWIKLINCQNQSFSFRKFLIKYSVYMDTITLTFQEICHYRLEDSCSVTAWDVYFLLLVSHGQARLQEVTKEEIIQEVTNEVRTLITTHTRKHAQDLTDSYFSGTTLPGKPGSLARIRSGTCGKDGTTRLGGVVVMVEVRCEAPL